MAYIYYQCFALIVYISHLNVVVDLYSMSGVQSFGFSFPVEAEASLPSGVHNPLPVEAAS